MSIQEINRGTVQGDQTGDTGFEGTLKINQNFTILDVRTRATIPFVFLNLNIDFGEPSELLRIANALNSLSLRSVSPLNSYILVTRRVFVFGEVDPDNPSRSLRLEEVIYGLKTTLHRGDTIGVLGTFQFNEFNLSYQRIGDNTIAIEDGVVTGANSVDLGNIGATPVHVAVNGLDPKVNIAGGLTPIVSTNGTDTQIHFYTGDEICLGVGVTTTSSDFELVTADDPAPPVEPVVDPLLLIVFGNRFTLRKAPANNDPAQAFNLQTGDFALDGVNIDGSEFWGSAQYIGTDPATDIDLPASWKPLFRSRI